MQLPTEQQFLMTQSGILDRIRGMLGGRAAEETVFGEVSTGAENDLERATAMARQMVCVYGMNKELGLARTIQHDPSPMLNSQDGGFVRDCSEATAQIIDREVKRILESTYDDAKEVLRAHRDQMERIVTHLLDVESIDGTEFYRMIRQPAPDGVELPG